MKLAHATFVLSLSLALLAGCTKKDPPAEAAAPAAPSAGIPTTVTDVDAATLPPELLAVVNATVPGMQVEEVEKKEREGRTYFDIEGRRADGSEVELDVLQDGSGYQVVEIQRDIPWSGAPAVARDAAVAGGLNFEPVRVIESTQTDGSVIYELFAEGKPDKPSKEVRVTDGKAEVLTQEWKH
jgi:hypothetical protein